MLADKSQIDGIQYEGDHSESQSDAGVMQHCAGQGFSRIIETNVRSKLPAVGMIPYFTPFRHV